MEYIKALEMHIQYNPANELLIVNKYTLSKKLMHWRTFSNLYLFISFSLKSSFEKVTHRTLFEHCSNTEVHVHVSVCFFFGIVTHKVWIQLSYLQTVWEVAVCIGEVRLEFQSRSVGLYSIGNVSRILCNKIIHCKESSLLLANLINCRRFKVTTHSCHVGGVLVLQTRALSY